MANPEQECHIVAMRTKSAVKQKGRRTTTVPVTTMEEIPILGERERAELLASLKKAEAQIKAGDFTEHDPKTLKERMLRIYRAKKR
jgi:hypothetical protein